MTAKPKKVQTAQQQMREMKKRLTEAMEVASIAAAQAEEARLKAADLRQELEMAKTNNRSLLMQVGRKEGYIDRVREVEKWQMEYHAKEQEARLGIKPSLPLSQIDLLREHLANSPEAEAKKILDVISEDLKNRVTGYDPEEGSMQKEIYKRFAAEPEVRYSSDPALRDWVNGS